MTEKHKQDASGLYLDSVGGRVASAAQRPGAYQRRQARHRRSTTARQHTREATLHTGKSRRCQQRRQPTKA
jgi:hypothetical protein